MTIENSDAVIRIQMQKRIFAILIALPIALFYATNLGDYLYGLTGVSRQILSFVLLGLYLSFYIYHIIIKSSYLYYSDENSRVVIRFYLLNPFNSKKNSYEIPKKQFVKFRLKKSLYNLREEVFVYQNISGTVAQYPPFSLSSLTNSQKQKLIKSLALNSQQ